MWQTFSIMWKLLIWWSYFKICRWKCNTVGWTMLKRESERLVWALAGSFPPANSTCIVVVLFIVWKFLWFFLMCSTHQPHWANKGKRMFQIYFCFSYLSEPNCWHVSQISTHRCLLFNFLSGSLPFSLLFHTNGCALALRTCAPLIFYLVFCKV